MEASAGAPEQPPAAAPQQPPSAQVMGRIEEGLGGPAPCTVEVVSWAPPPLPDGMSVGCWPACEQHCPSYSFTVVLQVGMVVCLYFAITSSLWVLAGFCACVATYFIHLWQCVRLVSALDNRTEGMDEITSVLDKPRSEDLLYAWKVTCYHYETRTSTSTDANGNPQTRTEQVRVNTRFAEHSGVLPSVDETPALVPQTAVQAMQITTHLDLDLSQSNYISKFNAWALTHRHDTHQDNSHGEDMPSRKKRVLAVWRPGSLEWLTPTNYWLANLTGFSLCFRWYAQSQLGEQDFTYRRKCSDI